VNEQKMVLGLAKSIALTKNHLLLSRLRERSAKAGWFGPCCGEAIGVGCTGHWSLCPLHTEPTETELTGK